VDGDTDTFLIVNVDYARKLVDMISTIGVCPLIEDVPFEFLEPASDSAPRREGEAAAD
jgi:hypothetical protein